MERRCTWGRGGTQGPPGRRSCSVFPGCPGASAMRPTTARHRCPAQGVIRDEQDDRADDGDEEAVGVEPGDAGFPGVGEDRADDAQGDIEEEALARLVDDLAGDEAGDQTEDYPS